MRRVANSHSATANERSVVPGGPPLFPAGRRLAGDLGERHQPAWVLAAGRDLSRFTGVCLPVQRAGDLQEARAGRAVAVAEIGDVTGSPAPVTCTAGPG